ncbi:hypothetical protein EDD85DRAFT_796409 [Armillaria nabsnona]|nr:hypothetical protein EDD85DRAFT_796409 [Armillaria nabsnona]
MHPGVGDFPYDTKDARKIASSPDANCAIPISFTDSRSNGAYKAPICNYICDKEAPCPSTVQVLYSQEVMQRLLREEIGGQVKGQCKNITGSPGPRWQESGAACRLLNTRASSWQVYVVHLSTRNDYFAKETEYWNSVSLPKLVRIDTLRGNIQFQGIPTPTPRYLLKIWAEFSLGVLGCTTHLLNDGDTAALTARTQTDDFVKRVSYTGVLSGYVWKTIGTFYRGSLSPAARTQTTFYPISILSSPIAARRHNRATAKPKLGTSDSSNAPKDAARFRTVSGAQNTPKLDPLNREHSVPARSF